MNALPILLLGGAAVYLMAGKKPKVRPDIPGDIPTDSGEPVVIYTAEWCGACQALKKELADAGIPFVEKDIDKDPEAAEFVMNNGDAIPITVVNGEVLLGAGILDKIREARKQS